MLAGWSLAWLFFKRPNKQLTEADADINTQHMGLKSGTPVAELGKGWKKLRRRATP